VIRWLTMQFLRRKKATLEDVVEHAPPPPSRHDEIQHLERRTDDAMRRIRALGVRLDIHELRHRADQRR
jgi:predicted amidohydrolase YtcJ